MKDQRRHARTPFHSEVRVTHPTMGSVVVMMRDFSDGGLFLLTKDLPVPPVGTIVEVQALCFGDQAPVLKAKIVRSNADGIGLMFCDDDEGQPDP